MNSSDGTTLSNPIDSNEKNYYNGKEEIKKLNTIWVNSVKSTDVDIVISKVDNSIKKEKEDIRE